MRHYRIWSQMLRRSDPLANPEPLIRRVYSYAAYRLGDGADAEDATGETFARAVRYRKSFDARAGSAQAWLLGIARRVVDDHLSQRQPSAGNLEDGVASLRVQDVADLAVERLFLRAALARLSTADQELLAMRYGADLAVKDIAAILGVRSNSVDVALHRALARLREIVEMSSSTQEVKREPA
jgi:RNA polymerase sigma-70 factor, ECF subfamily